MKFGDQLRGKITGFDQKGRGVFDFPLPQTPDETRNVAIPFTAPGDEVTATFVKRDQGFWIAKLASVEKPSADRVVAPCPHAGVCGGCLWQHLSYDAQLRTKKQMINLAFEKAGHEERIEDVIPSPDHLYYRNRMDYVVGWKGELGLKEYGSWNHYLDLSTCLLLDEETPRILKTMHALMSELNLEPWDAKKYTGQIRYCVIRLGKNTGERMITLIVKEANAIDEATRAEIVRHLSPFATTLYLGENPEITDLSSAKTLTLLHGNEYLTEETNGLRYLIHPNSFFQTNTRMAGALQNTVMNFLGVGAHGDAPSVPAKKILDLYCGLGFFGIAAAKHGVEVYGHELDAPAIELAKQNAKMNGVEDRCSFGAGPVEDLDWSAKNADAVIIDPARAGLHPRALEAILTNKPPVIVYVSCNFHRLVEELKQLKTAYRIERIAALDLFPQTPHVEVVTRLVRI